MNSNGNKNPNNNHNNYDKIACSQGTNNKNMEWHSTPEQHTSKGNVEPDLCCHMTLSVFVNFTEIYDIVMTD